MSSRDRALRQAAMTQAQTRIALANEERAAREAPITVEITGYDPDTGDYLAQPPGGGTIRVRSLTNGPLAGRLPLQRQPGSQDAFVNAPPSEVGNNSIAALERQIRELRSLINQLAAPGVSIQYGLGDPNQLTITPIEGFYFDTSSDRTFIPNNVSTAWVPTSSKTFFDGEEGSGTYYEGDIFQGADGNISVFDGSTWNQQWYCPSCSSDPASPGPGASS